MHANGAALALGCARRSAAALSGAAARVPGRGRSGSGGGGGGGGGVAPCAKVTGAGGTSRLRPRPSRWWTSRCRSTTASRSRAPSAASRSRRAPADRAGGGVPRRKHSGEVVVGWCGVQMADGGCGGADGVQQVGTPHGAQAPEDVRDQQREEDPQGQGVGAQPPPRPPQAARVHVLSIDAPCMRRKGSASGVASRCAPHTVGGAGGALPVSEVTLAVACAPLGGSELVKTRLWACGSSHCSPLPTGQGSRSLRVDSVDQQVPMLGVFVPTLPFGMGTRSGQLLSFCVGTPVQV